MIYGLEPTHKWRPIIKTDDDPEIEWYECTICETDCCRNPTDLSEPVMYWDKNREPLDQPESCGISQIRNVLDE